MFAVRNETLVTASPLRIWAALTRFDNYHRWHPFVRISGRPAVDTAVDYSFRIRPDRPRFRTMFARVRSVDTHVQLVITFGLGWLVSFEDAYLLLPSANGVRLVHSLGCRGLLSLLFPRGRAIRNFTNLLEATDLSLARHLSSARRGRASEQGRR